MKRASVANLNSAPYWDQVYEAEIKQRRTRGEPRLHDQLLRWLGVRAFEVQRKPFWLEAGCGLGDAIRHVEEAIGWQRGFGVDISSVAIEQLRRSDLAGEGRWTFETADLARLPYSAETFDLAYCSETIEHVEVPDEVFSELARVTCKGGLVVLTTPYRYRNKSEEHVYEFSPHDVGRWAASVGELEFLDCRILEGWHSMFVVIRKDDSFKPD